MPQSNTQIVTTASNVPPKTGVCRSDFAHVLIVDDDPNLQAFCRRMLEWSGLTCHCANSGSEALSQAVKMAYDLFLLDIELPDLRGDQLLSRLRDSAAGPYAKVIVFSGGATPDQMAEMLSLGADDYLAKPFTVAQLLARVKASLRLKEAQTNSDFLQRQLENTNRELESRVRSRTRELVEANDALQHQILERKRAEDAFRRAHLKNERLLEAISSILIELDEQGRVTKWNSGAVNTFALPPSEALGRLFEELPIRWEQMALVQRLRECRDQQLNIKLEDVAFLRSEGSRCFLDISLIPIPAGKEIPQTFLLFGEDLTERRQLHAQLMQAQKLESIGQLAAGIAHEINTPIQYIGDNTRFLHDAFQSLQQVLNVYTAFVAEGDDAMRCWKKLAEARALAESLEVSYFQAEIPRAVEQTLQGVSHVAQIVRAIKEFSHPGTQEKTPVDLNHAIENTITIARNEWKYVAEVVTQFDACLPPVPCLPGELNQVLLNLLINAAHAIGERRADDQEPKGLITLTTRCLPDYAEIRVSDTGCGIPDGIRSRIFDPFFTTKPVGKGTGQGLAIAHSVVTKKHGGTITFETEVGTGTTFNILLPLDGKGGPNKELP